MAQPAGIGNYQWEAKIQKSDGTDSSLAIYIDTSTNQKVAIKWPPGTLHILMAQSCLIFCHPMPKDGLPSDAIPRFLISPRNILNDFLPYLLGYHLADIRTDLGRPALGFALGLGLPKSVLCLPGRLFAQVDSDGIQSPNPKPQIVVPKIRPPVVAGRRTAIRSRITPRTAPTDPVRATFRPNRIRRTITRVS